VATTSGTTFGFAAKSKSSIRLGREKFASLTRRTLRRCRYSTTYGALREERADHRRGDTKPEDGPDTVTESNWRYAGSGYSPGEADIALGIAEDLASLREIKRDMIAEGWRYAG
jgi:hypothetical protein